VAKDYSQKHGLNYDEVFTPVARLETIRLIIITVVQHRWRIYQMDIKPVIPNGFLEKRVFIEQSVGYEVKGHEKKVFKLNKTLNGLKQAPRAWYSRIDDYT
jgi:hypothetical protein